MPTFFSRRYMREKPRSTERWVGAFVLLLLVFIVGAFLLTGGLLNDTVASSSVLTKAKSAFGISEAPLFTVAPENMKPPAPPHDVRVARSMLPALPEPWKGGGIDVIALRAGQPLAESRPAVDATLVETITAFGGRYQYHTEYHQTGTVGDSERLNVAIADMVEPPNAFGAWRARMPEGAQNVAIGRGGWQAQDPARIGFWSGRYYTELTAGKLLPQDLESLARVVAGVQLVYGGPFWAESVLPSDGRVQGSLRYVRKEPLGLSELSDCWLADYPDGLTVGVMQTSGGQKILAALRDRLATTAAAPEPTEGGDDGEHEGEHEGEGEGEDDGEGDEYGSPEGDSHGSQPSGSSIPTPLPPGGVAGKVGDRVLAAFETGPYLFVVAGAETSAVQTLALAVAERWQAPTEGGHVGIAAADAGKPPVAGQARFAEVPSSSVEPPTRIERYAENLYEKIDGKEGLFRAYYVVDLKFGRYLDPDRQQSFDVYIYDMREPDNALGIFILERSEKAVALDIGRDGYESGTSVYFWKGQYYVNVLGPGEGGPEALQSSKQIAQAIAETIADSGARSWAEALLPEENRIPHSFTYLATSALGYDFLQRLYLTKYEVGGKSFQMYLTRTAGPEAARDLFKQFAEATQKYDKILSREASEGGETLVSDSLGIIGVAFHKGVYFGGVSECDDQALAVAQAKLLRDRLSLEDAGEQATPAPAAATEASPPSEVPSVPEHSKEGEESGY